MRILCLNPSMSVPISWGKPQVHQPLGLAYVAGVLQKSNEVTFLDANSEGFERLKKVGDRYYSGLSDEEIVDRISRINPEAVCMSITFTINSINALNILKEIKKRLPKLITVVGGAHVTVRPEETLRNPCVDFVVLGEGEKTVGELFDCISRNGDLGAVKGIGFKDNGAQRITPARELIRNLDDLPFPALNLMPMEKYFQAYDQKRSQRKAYIYNKRWTTVITSRGCPMNCIFCSVHLTMGKMFRPRSPENVVAEMERDYQQFGIRHFNLEDDNMTWNTERFERICDLIVEKNLKISWSAPNGIRADRINEELVRKMKLSGCRRVFVAPESGSQRVLNEVIDKRMKLQDIENAVEIFAKNGIEVDLSFVIGLPGETKEEIWESINFAKKLRQKGASVAGFNIATPLYGTRLYEEVVKKGYFDANTDPSRLSPSEALIQTPEWTRDDILGLRSMADWSVNLSVFQKITHPLKNPKKLPGYLIYFITNIGKVFRK